jgi:predicted NUDIX family NTP pyrophosphohydrolase
LSRLKQAAGLLLYRKRGQTVEVLLVHPGGPYWAKKDKQVWSIPKGELNDDEDVLVAAKREFQEEIGSPPPAGAYHELLPVKQSNKVIYAWAVEADIDVSTVRSNRISIEWPPRSGASISIPEVDKADWFVLSVAREKLVRGQVDLITQLADYLHMPIEPVQQDGGQVPLF